MSHGTKKWMSQKRTVCHTCDNDFRISWCIFGVDQKVVYLWSFPKSDVSLELQNLTPNLKHVVRVSAMSEECDEERRGKDKCLDFRNADTVEHYQRAQEEDHQLSFR